jgi:hypothetical protein
MAITMIDGCSVAQPVSRKVVIVGAGDVGASFAYALLQSGSAECIVLIDSRKELAEGQALDLAHGLPFVPTTIVRAGSPDDYNDAAVSLSSSSHSQKTLQFGCRLLFHVLKLEMFDISLGPELGYQTDFTPDGSNIWLSGPFNIDVHFTENFAARLSTHLVTLNYFSNSSPSDHTTFTFNMQSVFQPTFGFYFTF